MPCFAHIDLLTSLPDITFSQICSIETFLTENQMTQMTPTRLHFAERTENPLLFPHFKTFPLKVVKNPLRVKMQSFICIMYPTSMGKCNTILSAYTKYRHLG